MSGAIKAIVGVVAVVVGIVTYQPWLVSIGASLLLNAAASLFIKAPRASPLAGVSINYSGTLEPRRIIYGTLKMGGINCLPPLTSGANNDFMHQVLAFGGEQISGYGDVYFNQIRIANADIGALPTGLVGGTGVYNGKAWIRRYDGSQTAVDATLSANFSAWDASHIGYGIPYAAIMLQWDQAVYSSGFPQITFIVKGKKIYDPRLDSTNGGSGSQRYATPSTWAYSVNPALCLRDYLTSALGLNEAQTRIDDTLVAAAANICDQTVAVPIPVLIGLTNWTNGSAIVTGINSSFLLALTSGAYLKAPNGTMLQISGVPTDDTHLTLLAAYGGANASAQVTQYNNAGSATSTTQPRYTCNTILDATATFNTNIGTLASAMMGHCLYSAGKWRMYAGAWSGSAFTLGPDDIVGAVSVQCGTPRQNLYNAVRGNFLDPQQNYAASEFPPIINAPYAAADGETIYIETNFPCCVDRFEAQRNAIIFSRQGRNQKTITVQYGMTAYGVKIYETGSVTIPEIGWNAQSVRCVGWRFNPQGMIELGLQEAYSADFTDPLVGDYAITGVNVAPQAGLYLPYPPTGLIATSMPGGIMFQVTLPTQVAPGTAIELWEYTANTPFSSAALIATSNTSLFGIPKLDTVTRYYWVRTKGPNNQKSSTYPAGNGLAGSAFDASNQFVPVNLCFVNHDYAIKLGGSSAWDSCIYTIQSHPTCHISAKMYSLSDHVMVGLSDTPTASASYTNMQYGWYNNAGTWHIYESGSDIGSYGAVALTDVPAVTYDGSTVTYLLNGVSKRTVATASRTFYGFCPFYDPNASVNSLGYGPTTLIKINDTTEIGIDAVSQILSTFDPFTVTHAVNAGNSPVNLTICSVTIACTGSPIAIDWSLNYECLTQIGAVVTSFTLSVYIDGAVLASGQGQYSNSSPTSVSPGVWTLGTMSCADAPSAGSHTYSLHLTASGTGTGTGVPVQTGFFNTQNTFLKVREIKR